MSTRPPNGRARPPGAGSGPTATGSGPIGAGGDGSRRTGDSSEGTGDGGDGGAGERAALAELRPLLILLEHASAEARLQLEQVLMGLLRAPPTAAERHVAELGHLAGLLDSELAIHIPNHPRAPVRVTQRDYDRTRPPQAPSSELLVDRYVHWEWACRAAWGLQPDGRKTVVATKPWPCPIRGRLRPDAYTREEALDSIRQCAFALCRRPSFNVFKEWVPRERRRRKRASGGLSREVRDAAGDHAPLRLCGIDSVYRIFPKGWRTALSAADITAEFLATAVAAKLPERIEAAPEPELADTVAGRLAMLTTTELKALSLTPSRRDTLAHRGCGKLPLRQAVLLAHALHGSLDWLAGADVDPGRACPVNARLDRGRYAAARTAVGVREQVIASAMRTDTALLRRVLKGSAETTLGQAAAMATALDAGLADLVT